jgi:hypothetical protein
MSHAATTVRVLTAEATDSSQTNAMNSTPKNKLSRIFWDLDECLVSSNCSTHPPRREKENYHHFRLADDPHYYRTIIRPSALEVLKFSRDLVGDENVFVLTTSMSDYAAMINEIGKFGFPPARIYSRTHLWNHRINTAYGGRAYIPCKEIGSPNNVIIDNLMPRRNEEKISFLGIGRTWQTNYYQVRDYYGSLSEKYEAIFVANVKDWLSSFEICPVQTPEI